MPMQPLSGINPEKGGGGVVMVEGPFTAGLAPAEQILMFSIQSEFILRSALAMCVILLSSGIGSDIELASGSTQHSGGGRLRLK